VKRALFVPGRLQNVEELKICCFGATLREISMLVKKKTPCFWRDILIRLTISPVYDELRSDP